MAHDDHCHCNDYTRSQMLRAAAAKAATPGAGLPAIESGMPLPAGTGLSRRSFLFRAGGLALSVYGATKLPLRAFEEGIAGAATPPRVLVSLFFEGGIDALNVLAPINDSSYQTLRPNLKLTSGLNFTEDPNLFWHSSAQSLKTLHEEGKVTVFPAIGYTSPNQSHFTSRHYYEIGEVQVGASTGWLGRYIDQVGTPDNPLQGLSLADSLSPMLATASNPIAAVESVTGYKLDSWVPEPVQTPMFNSFGAVGAMDNGGLTADTPSLTQARRATKQTNELRQQLSAFNTITGPPFTPAYPNTTLGNNLKALAALLAAGLPIQCVTLSATGGYDTHSNEATTLSNNLSKTTNAVLSFQRDLEARGLQDRVITEMWSEFGRRPQENGTGTDHGAAGVAFVVGSKAKGQMIGGFPGVAPANLDSKQNLKNTSDFRSMYCSLLEQWLEQDAEPIIPGAAGFARYDLIKP